MECVESSDRISPANAAVPNASNPSAEKNIVQRATKKILPVNRFAADVLVVVIEGE